MSAIHVTYSQIRDIPLQLEISLPSTASSQPLPLVLYFHGGALITGGKNDVLLKYVDWLKDASLNSGFAFAGVDYPLLHPFTARDQITQVKALFQFLASDAMTTSLPEGVSINPRRVAVSGFSAGGYLCRLAALYADPKPAALISAFGMGGSFLSDVFVHGNKNVPRPNALLDESDPQPTVDCPLIFDPSLNTITDPSGRWDVGLWAMVEGNFLNYLTGVPGFTSQLRTVPAEERYARVTEMGWADVFPEIAISEGKFDVQSFPPSFIYHGAADPLVLPAESSITYEALKRAGVRTELRLVEGAIHIMIDPTTGELHAEAGPLQEEAFEFIAQELQK